MKSENLIDSIVNATNIGNTINNKTITLIKILLLLIFIGIISFSIWNIINNPSVINIIFTVLGSTILWLTGIIIYRTFIIKLLTESTINYNILLFLEKERLYIKDMFILKNLSLMDLKNIRDEENVEKINELSNSLDTIEGKELKDRILKVGGFINYKIDKK